MKKRGQMKTQTGVKVVGYGPPGLLKAVKEAKWNATMSGGENFEGIRLGGYCLTRPPDKDCSLKLKLEVVTTIRKGKQISVRGWAFPSALMAAQCAAEIEGGLSVFGGPVKLANIPLTKKPTKQNTTCYEIDITPLS